MLPERERSDINSVYNFRLFSITFDGRCNKSHKPKVVINTSASAYEDSGNFDCNHLTVVFIYGDQIKEIRVFNRYAGGYSIS